MFGTAFPTVRINELDVNPPGNDNPYEYVEIEGPANMSSERLLLRLGRRRRRRSGDGIRFLLDWEHGTCHVRHQSPRLLDRLQWHPDHQEPRRWLHSAGRHTVVTDPLFDQAGGVLQNGTNSFLLVYSPGTQIKAYAYDPTTGSVTTQGTDSTPAAAERCATTARSPCPQVRR